MVEMKSQRRVFDSWRYRFDATKNEEILLINLVSYFCPLNDFIGYNSNYHQN